MKLRFLAFFLALTVFSSSIHAEDLPPVPKNLFLTSTTAEQLNPNYWIQRIPNAEKPLKSPRELKEFNEYIHRLITESVDVFSLARTRSGKEVSGGLEHTFKALKSRKLYDAQSKDMPKSFFEEEVKPIMQWDKVPKQIKVQFGTAARSTSVRALPTNVKILEKPYDIEFDQLQFTLIKVWTPLAVLHRSSDDKWFYIQAPYTRGWVQSKDICIFPDREKLKSHVQSKKFLSVTGDHISVFSNANLDHVLLKASMGTVLPYSKKTERYYEVMIPKKGSREGKLVRGYVSLKSDVSVGYLPYSQANMIRQAFKLLGKRYGWGGAYNGRDCSGFTHDVFLSLGVNMPRNSQEQAFVGTKLGFFKAFNDVELKEQILSEARPGITLMAMAHHLMLYLGEVNGKFYTIHSTWAERVSLQSDKKNRINQIVVTDLSLNGRSYLGSLFDRIISINEVD